MRQENVSATSETGFTQRKRVWQLRFCVLGALVLFVLGVVLPVLKIQPSLHEDPILNSVARVILNFDTTPKYYSVCSGIMDLLQGGGLEKILAIVLLIFSMLFPFSKICILVGTQIGSAKCKTLINRPGFQKVVLYSLLELFVLAVILSIFKVVPGGTIATLWYGIPAFVGSIVLTLWATSQIRSTCGHGNIELRDLR